MSVMMKNGIQYGAGAPAVANSYDNSTSHLSATNTQDAIDEISQFDGIKNRPEVADETDIMADVITPLPGYRNQGENYSTSEQVIGTWIDGKPIYQRTYVTTVPVATTAGTYVTSDININSLNIDNAWVAPGSFFLNDAGGKFNFPDYTTNSGYHTKCGVNYDPPTSTFSIRIMNAVTTHSGNACYITINYTKTTD